MPKKTKTLPAGPCFGHTMLRGGQIEGKFLRCYYLLSEEGEAPLRVGFAVSSRVFNAVRRNRIKRLLREAVAREIQEVENALSAAGRHASAVFFFKGSKSIPPTRLKVHTIQPDVSALCRMLASKLQSDHA